MKKKEADSLPAVAGEEFERRRQTAVRARERFLADAKSFEDPDRDADNRTTAVSYIIGFPHWLEVMGYGWWPEPTDPADRFDRLDALHCLKRTHLLAAEVLMREAGRLGIDGVPLWESARVCQDLFDRDPSRCTRRSDWYRYWSGDFSHDLWPDCVGSDVGENDRHSIRKGEATLRQVIATLATLATLNMAPAREPRKTHQRRSELFKCGNESVGEWLKPPLPLAELARCADVDPRTARSYFSGGLIQKSPRLWTCRLDTGDLDAKTKDRLIAAAKQT